MTNYELVYYPKRRKTPDYLPFEAKNAQEARAYAWGNIELSDTFGNIRKRKKTKPKITLPDNARLVEVRVIDDDLLPVRISGIVAYDGQHKYWITKKKEKIVTYEMRGDGKILKTIKNPMAKKDYTKVTQQGMRIYKIWYSPLTESYDVLARKSDGEWAYGRDYNLKTGIWQGGRYSMNLNQLYERVGGTFGRVYKDNHVGKTGKF